MNPRHVLLAAAAALVLPVLSATPAFAVDSVLCVGLAGPTCTDTQPDIQAAYTAAVATPTADTILVGAGTFADGPWGAPSDPHGIVLKGAGQGQTILTLVPSVTPQTYFQVNGGTIEDLTIKLAATSSSGDVAMSLTQAHVDRVTIDGAGTDNTKGIQASGSTIAHSSVLLPLDSPQGNVGVFLFGGTTVSDSVVTGGRAVYSDNSGVTPDVVSRLLVTASGEGIYTDAGTVNVDDTLVDLGTSSGFGLWAENDNNSTSPKTLNANHVTIVGGGAGSRGVRVGAAATGAQQVASIHLDNSVVRGPAISIQIFAAHSGDPAAVSNATVTATYSDWATATQSINVSAGGTGSVVSGAGNVDGVDPLFVNPATKDYRLQTTSTLVDKGELGAGGPATDLAGHTRVVDGDLDGVARRDMGAYELQDITPPETTLSSGPTGLTNDATPTFGFTSEPGATFQCRLDNGAFVACTSPLTTPVLPDGAHTFQVRATDAASNVDMTPATRSFTVDATPPDTAISKAPPKRTTHARIKVRFPWIDSSPPGTFECSLDGSAFKACTSPFKVKLKVGKHIIKVRAIDAAGNADPTPARVKVRRVKP